MKMFEFTVYEELSSCTDSLLINSETTIATLKIDEFCLYLETQGEVRIVDTISQDVYKTPSEFPQELKNYIKSGDIWTNPSDRYYIDNNNWFNWTLTINGNTIDDDICEGGLDNLNEVELLGMMYDVFKCFTN